MERGQPEPPADGNDEAVEAIDAVGVPADGVVSDRSLEVDPSSEARSEAAPDAGPPVPWLTYIRARAPWLLAPGGALSGDTVGASADVVPHGPSAHVERWPSASPAGMSVAAGRDEAAGPTFDDGAPAAWAGAQGKASDQEAPFPAPSSRAGEPGYPASPAAHAALSADPVGVQGVLGVEGVEAVERSRTPARDRPRDAERSEVPEREVPTSGPADPFERAASLRAPGDDAAAAPAIDRGADATVTPGSLASAPPLEIPVEPQPVDPWPAFAEEPAAGIRTGTEFPPFFAGLDRPSPEPGFPSPYAARHTPAPMRFGAVPASTLASPSAAPAPSSAPGAWRVRATSADTSTVARLALPAWPALPEEPADDTPADWRSIERRFQRAARLDREQRRR